MSNNFPNNISELPKTPYYAILTETSVCIPGDERSRTNPGHGYPAFTSYYWSMQVFPDKIAWEKEIIRRSSTKRTYGSNNWQAVKVEPANITITVAVDVK
jgi:hypothetical protein